MLKKLEKLVLGLLLTATVSAAGIGIAKIPAVHAIGFSAVTAAIILGMIAGNTFYHRIAVHCGDGVNFSKARLLRLGIVLYGFNLTFQEIAKVGVSSVVADALIIIATFMLTWFLGKKLFKLDDETVALMGAGASICGAAAVLAAVPVVRGGSDKTAVAIATVVIFGTIAMFFYPEMYHWHWWPFGQEQFGVYIGTSVHEVAQVYAAGAAVGDAAAPLAVTAKMIRVMMLAPFLIVLSWWWVRRGGHAHDGAKHKMVIPWFAVWFIAAAGFNSLHLLPEAVVEALKFIDVILLTMAMAALGLTTHVKALKHAGIKPMLLGAVIFVWLIMFGGLLQLILPKLLS